MITKHNWKKYAEAALKQEDAELAFAKSASAIVESKAAPIFKPPYFLGFEVVSSDSSFSKMIGIFVFRIEKTLLYVPVAYIDGHIKMTDLLYDANSKLFTLLSPDWCDYYLNKIEMIAAKDIEGSKIQDRGKQDLQLRWLAYPPYMSKGASTIKKLERKEGYQAESPLVIFDFIKSAKDIFSEEDAKQALENIMSNDKVANEQPKHLLHDFVVAGGYEMFNKLASWIENDFEFANNIISFCDQEDFMPKEVLSAQRAKSAEENLNKKVASEFENKNIVKNPDIVKEASVLVHLGKYNPLTTKTAAEQMEEGYDIEDLRDKKDLDVLVVNPTEQFTGISSGLGIAAYDVLTTQNTIVPCAIVTGFSDDNKTVGLIISLDKSDGNNGCISYDNIHDEINVYGHNSVSVLVSPVMQAGFHDQVTPWKDILANEIVDGSKDDEIKAIVKDVPEAGKIYAIFDPKFSYLSDEAFYIKDVKEDPEKKGRYVIKAYTLAGYTRFYPEKLSDPHADLTLIINPDSNKLLLDLKVFNPGTKWIEMPRKKVKTGDDLKEEGNASSTLSTDEDDDYIAIDVPDWVPGTISTYFTLTNKLGYKMASLQYDRRKNAYKLDFEGNKDLKFRNKVATQVRLMCECNLDKEDAKAAMDEARARTFSNPFTFMHKSAARIILNPDPDFYEGYDSDLGVKVTIPETIPVMTQDLSINAPAPRYGDTVPSLTPDFGDLANSTMPAPDDKAPEDIFLMTATPNMLGELARTTGQNQLFEHGVIGSLAKTTEIGSFISEFLPDLAQGEDKLGRLIFLVNIAPASVISMYGSDDIKSLENTLLNIFKQQGELILELNKKNKAQQENITVIENNN